MEPKRKPTGLPKKEPEADKPKKRTAGAATAVPISHNKKTAPTPEQLETRVTAKETVKEQDTIKNPVKGHSQEQVRINDAVEPQNEKRAPVVRADEQLQKPINPPSSLYMKNESFMQSREAGAVEAPKKSEPRQQFEPKQKNAVQQSGLPEPETQQQVQPRQANLRLKTKDDSIGLKKGDLPLKPEQPIRRSDTVQPWERKETIHAVPTAKTKQASEPKLQTAAVTVGIKHAANTVRQRSEEVYRQTAEPSEESPSEYAEHKTEQYGRETASVVSQSVGSIEARARQAAIRRFRQQRQEHYESKTEQEQTEAEDETIRSDEATDTPAAAEDTATEPIPEQHDNTGVLQKAADPLPRSEQSTKQAYETLARQERSAGDSLSIQNGENEYASTQEKTAPQKADSLRLPELYRDRAIVGYSTDRSNAVSSKEGIVPGTAKETHFSVKTAEHPVKETRQTIKTAQKSIQTSQQTAKAAQKTAKASAKAAKETSVKAAQATAKAGQAAYKTLVAVVKAIIAAVKQLVSMIAAGGWIAVLVIVLIAAVAIFLLSAFGVFYSNDVTEGRPMTEAIEEINSEFADSITARINRYKRKYKPDELVVVYEGDTDSTGGTVMNWPDVLGVYAVKTTSDPDNPKDVLIITPEKAEELRSIFQRMNSVSYKTELDEKQTPATDENGDPLYDEDGELVMDTTTTLTITVRVSSKDYRGAAAIYGFTDHQNEMLREIMQPEYYPLFASLLGDVIGDGGEYGFGLDIQPDLPPNELGYQIVQAAKRYIGRSYASMDCSTLARTAYADVGLTSMKGLSSVRMAEKCQEMGCLFTDPSMLQAGDLIFFARYDPKRGKDYCGDVNRCGTGKCRRWLHIHHVAIYINDEYLIDSTGGDNSVQIRKHWGMDTARWKWVCFGRLTT